ncbi:MAG: HD domain-containing protein [Clostridium baratii]|uniref:HD domain-containing protein n=1 Tax=Clostridium baratii TaxID=1561 RepID=UPI00242C466B|nr:HD domain-containing protein [Clostridium baratii]MBS6005710.1 HD domain-containing protein [Clostridium baratii]
MDKINEILQNNIFKANMIKLEKLEENREFCRHGINHSLDVARIAYIMTLEKELAYSKEIIYAVALLHDIGRVMQYENGVSHHEGSVILAEEILKNTSYDEEEISIIIGAIKNHRNKENASEFNKLIFKSDKLSRNCFICKSYDECYWDSNKKNNIINY